MKVLALVDRDTDRANAVVVDDLKVSTLAPIVRANVAEEARIFTDAAKHYGRASRAFADHQSVHHQSGEYGRGEAPASTVEGHFSVFKRGMRGVY